MQGLSDRRIDGEKRKPASFLESGLARRRDASDRRICTCLSNTIIISVIRCRMSDAAGTYIIYIREVL